MKERENITRVNIADRMRQAREAGGLTQPELARRAGVSQGTIGNIESGARKQPRDLLAIAAALNVSPAWLATGSGPMQPGESRLIDLTDNPDYPAIRRASFKLSAGASGYGVDYDGAEDAAPIVFRREWYERNGYRPARLLAVRVANGSMEPGLWDGDTVVVNLDAVEPIDGAVFAVNYEGELSIKRLVRDAGQWWLVSDNADQRRYPRKVCDSAAHILGRIVHKQSEKI